jgi:Ca2+ transporting ATPase
MAAIAVSMILHMLILYVHPLAVMFSVTPLTFSEWKAVFWLSFPVILVDELLKFFSRRVKGQMPSLRFRKYDLLPKSLTRQE